MQDSGEKNGLRTYATTAVQQPTPVIKQEKEMYVLYCSEEEHEEDMAPSFGMGCPRRKSSLHNLQTFHQLLALCPKEKDYLLMIHRNHYPLSHMRKRMRIVLRN